jgi:hypothetical protein
VVQNLECTEYKSGISERRQGPQSREPTVWRGEDGREVSVGILPAVGAHNNLFRPPVVACEADCRVIPLRGVGDPSLFSPLFRLRCQRPLLRVVASRTETKYSFCLDPQIFCPTSLEDTVLSMRGLLSVAVMCGLFVLAFQNLHDRLYRVPAACGRRHTEHFVDLAKIADCLHVATVLAEDESLSRRDHSHEPLLTWWKCEWQPARGRPSTGCSQTEQHQGATVRFQTDSPSPSG